LSLAVTTRQEVTVLTLAGDVLNEESLRAAFRVLSEAGAHALHLDLRAVRLPTAEGLGLLITLNKELRARGGKLTLLNVAPDPYEVFEVTRLAGVLDVRRAPPRQGRSALERGR
jgi:anti-sigma B factor antagonist